MSQSADENIFGEDRQSIIEGIPEYCRDKPELLLNYATGILSDAQHVQSIAQKMTGSDEKKAFYFNQSRQFINKAKFIMSLAVEQLIKTHEQALDQNDAQEEPQEQSSGIRL